MKVAQFRMSLRNAKIDVCAMILDWGLFVGPEAFHLSFDDD